MGVPDVASLGARADQAWASGPADAASVGEAYVKRGKTDANDAEAICEAVTRPRCAPVK
jgi:hypothetical protein